MNYLKLDPGIDDPRYATGAAAGIDLQAAETMKIPPDQTLLVPTGIAVEIPEAHVGLLFLRSSVAVKYGLQLANGVGVIDSDYRGEIKVALYNPCRFSRSVVYRDRIAQLVVIPICRPALKRVESLTETARGAGGFGSTGQSSYDAASEN